MLLAMLLLYIAIGTAIAIASRKAGIKSIRDYYVAGGRLGRILAFGTYAATTYSAFMMIGLVGLAYKTGVMSLGFELLYLASTIYLLSTVGHRLWRLSKQRGWVSPSEMMGDLYTSRAIPVALSIMYLIAVVPYLAAQVQGVGVLLEKEGLNYHAGVALGALIILAWMSVGGMWSVASTDLYQALWMLAGGAVYVAWLANNVDKAVGGSLNALRLLGESGYLGVTGFWKPNVFLAYVTPWLFFAITNPQVIVRLFVHRDEKSYRDSVLYFSVFGFLYTIISVGIGLLARALTLAGGLRELGREDVTPYLLSLMAPYLSSFISVSIIAAAISTGNSIALAVASSVHRDLLAMRAKGTMRVGYSIAIQALLVTAASAIALSRSGYILDLSVMTSVLLLPQAPLVIYAACSLEKGWPRPRLGALASLLAGFATALAYSAKLGPRGAFLSMINGLPLPILVLLISTGTLAVSALLSRALRREI